MYACELIEDNVKPCAVLDAGSMFHHLSMFSIQLQQTQVRRSSACVAMRGPRQSGVGCSHMLAGSIARSTRTATQTGGHDASSGCAALHLIYDQSTLALGSFWSESKGQHQNVQPHRKLVEHIGWRLDLSQCMFTLHVPTERTMQPDSARTQTAG